MVALSAHVLFHEHSASLHYPSKPASIYTCPSDVTLSMTKERVMPFNISSAEVENTALFKEDDPVPMKANTFDHPDQFDTLPADKATLCSLLRKCGDAKALSQGKRLHSHIMNSGSLAKDTLLGNLIVQMYSKCDSLNDALDVFTNIQHKNVYSWSLVLGACIQHGKGALALELFHQMRTGGVIPDNVTYVTILDACENKRALLEGELIHAEVIENGCEMDVFVGTALVSMYGRCGALDAAFFMFERMPTRTVVSWNAINTVCVQSGGKKRALNIFHLMLKEGVAPSNLSFLSALEACCTVEEAQAIHNCIRQFDLESDIFVSTELISTYGKFGRLDDARKLFESIVTKTAFSWSAMIAACTQNDQGKDALQLFHRMELSGVSPVQAILTSVISACAIEAAVGEGELIHAQAVCLALDRDLHLINALIDMYANCGHLATAQQIFDKMCERDVSSWNVITGAHALYGNATHALSLFHQMLQKGATPDEFTFNNILIGCSHAGLVNEAHSCFLSMRPVFGVTQMVEHYNCIIDLLGRVGRLDESEYLINHMRVHPMSSSWMSLLNGCKLHNDRRRANRAASSLFALEHKTSGPYVVLSHTLKVLSGEEHI